MGMTDEERTYDPNDEGFRCVHCTRTDRLIPNSDTCWRCWDLGRRAGVRHPIKADT